MRHRRGGWKLGRNRGQRRGLFRNLVAALLLHDRIETTEAKGKFLRVVGDRMISLGIAGDLASRRRAIAYVQDQKAVGRLFSKIAPLFSSSDAPKGGYTRLVKTRVRYGDAAPLVIVEITRKVEPDQSDIPASTSQSPADVTKP